MASLLHSVLIPALMAACLLLSAACGGSSDPAAQADAAQNALSSGKYSDAREQAESGLKAAGADKNLSWRLERIRVEALAAQGQGPEVVSTMTRLHGAYPKQCDAPLYAKLGNALVGAGKPVDAVVLADAGIKQFPDRKADFEGLIREIQAGGDSEANAKLKAMGYL